MTERVNVPRGQNLRQGCWYIITRLDPNDHDPSMRVGDVVLCAEARPGCIDPDNHESDGMGTQWFADYGVNSDGEEAYRTLVDGVAFLREGDSIASEIVSRVTRKQRERS